MCASQIPRRLIAFERELLDRDTRPRGRRAEALARIFRRLLLRRAANAVLLSRANSGASGE